MALQVPSTGDASRPLANFPLDVWGDYFASIPLNDSSLKSYCIQTDELKEEVKEMLILTHDPMEKMKFIDSICRLGLSYHFEEEIDEQLNRIFYAEPRFLDENDYDLYSIAVAFQVFRQHGFRMLCDVFNKFMDKDGEFKDSLCIDLMGMLSLYEAAYLSMPGEDILDEARAFTKAHLEISVAHELGISTHLRRLIMNALELPYQRSIARLEARKYINFYESQECPNEILLKFAKLDYNRVQLLYQQELRDLSKWWKGMDIAAALPFGRNRVVEFYSWAVGVHFEPHYARGRIMVAKILTLVTYVDDVYDAYGKPEELKLFTEAINRWDYKFLDQLPDYLKIIYRAYLDIFCEFENDVKPEGRSFAVHYTKKAVQEIVRGYQEENDTLEEGSAYVPSLEEYLSLALITFGTTPVMASSFMGTGETAGIKEFEWLLSKPKLWWATSLIGRLMDDISTNKFEQKRVHIASSVECYMKQHGVSNEKAIEELKKMTENGWKVMNEELMRPNEVPRNLLINMVNSARLLNVVYRDGLDRLTNSEHWKDVVTDFFIDEIPIPK